MRTMSWVLLFLVSLMSVGSAQSVPAQPVAQSAAGASAPQPSAQPTDPMVQMRDDLNRLESLNQNMSSEIEFLHDQNLQILLRTNSRMWMLLIRDLRLQLDREEQNRKTPQAGARDSARPGQK